MKLQVKTMLNNVKNFIIKRKEFFIIVILLLISGIAHGYNMFHFPYYFDDEGTYIAQAWATLTQESLSHYTYWYDHPPAGWFLIALWAKLTGGFFTFGISVNSGRVLMLLLHLLSTFLLFKIAIKFTNDYKAAIVSSFIFILSPLAVHFHRMVFLDNIMIFWVLWSLYLILFSNNRLRYIFASAICLGIGVLTKEIAIVFLPILLYTVYVKFYKASNKKNAVLIYFILVCIISSFYFLFAFLKGELFAMGSMLDAGGEHVSLIETLKWHSSRSGGENILDLNSRTWMFIKEWIRGDFIIFVLGMVTVFLNLIIGIKDKFFRIASLIVVSFSIFLFRGGLINNFYIIPLLPFLSLNIGMATTQFNKSKKLSTFIFFITISLCSLFYIYHPSFIKLYTVDQTSEQVEAIKWISSNIPKENTIIIDDYAYIDLRETGFKWSESIWYWKVGPDPEIAEDVLFQDWKKIDYIAATPKMKGELKMPQLSLLNKSFSNSVLIKNFEKGGWSVEIYKTEKEKNVLQDSWQSYKTHFITSEGKVIDPYSNNSTTSEGQSYALLRAVWIDDKETFDKVLSWTNENLKLKNSNLFAWSWIQDNNRNWGTRDKGTATDADEDIALALLFASKKWDDPAYLEQAKKIINDIWDYEVVEVKGKHYLTAGNWTSTKEDIVINPSYLSPYTYRIFAEVDPSHNWMELVNTSYDILFHSSQPSIEENKNIGLPPNWCAINPDGEIISAKHLGDFSQDYSYDAIRTPWRIALDYQWNKEPRAKKYLESLEFLNKEWTEKKKISASYSHDGEHWENYESTASYGTNLGYFIVIHPETSKEIYEEKILGKYFEDEEKSYWNDPKNYYEQNWGWFGTALYADKLPNLWNQ